MASAGALLASGAGAATTTYFVDIASRGGACSDARTPAQNTFRTPWCTLAHAIKAAPAGSTVLLRAGSYPRTGVTAANKGSYVSFGPYTGEVPVVNGMALTDVSFLRFVNLKTTGGVSVRDGQNIEVIGGESALSPAGTRTATAFNLGAVSDVLIAERHIHDGFNAVLIASSVSPRNTRVTVRDNRIERMGGDAVHIGGNAQQIKVRDNRIVNVRPRKDMIPDAHSDAVQVIGPSWDVSVVDNRVTGGRGFLFMVSPEDQGRPGFGHRNAQVVNNLLLGYAFGMRTWSLVGSRIVNNTIWGTGTESLSVFDRNGTANDRTTNLVLANNLIKVLKVGTGVGFATRDYNVIGTGPLGGARDVQGTPAFVDPAALDFELEAGSKGVDSATTALAPPADQMGLSRYGTPDRGALERHP